MEWSWDKGNMYGGGDGREIVLGISGDIGI